MELTQLKYFLEVARTEHVTQSAKNLFIVQPALTQSIHKLERELGVKLFKNEGRNIRLTENGRFFYERLRPVYEELMSLPSQLTDFADKQNNNIKLNVLAASTLITQAIIDYKRDHRDINVDIIQNKETNVFDICVRTYTAYRPELDNTSSDEVFIRSEAIFLAVPNSPQYRRVDSISLFDLKNEKFIRLYGSRQYQKICNELCERIGFRGSSTFESDNVLAVKDAIAAGIGVGFWPEISWGKMDHKKVKLLKIVDADFKRDIVVSLRRNKQDNSCAEQFFSYLTKYVQKQRSRG